MSKFWDSPEDFSNTRMRCSFGLTEIALPIFGAELLGLGGAAAEGAAGFGLAGAAAEGAAGVGITELGLGGAAGGEGLSLTGEALPSLSTPTAGTTPFAPGAPGASVTPAGGPIPSAPGAAAVAPAPGSLPAGATLDPTSVAALGDPNAGIPISEAPGAASTPGAAKPGGLSLESIGQGITNSINKNPLGIGLAAAGLGYSVANSNKSSAAVDAMKDQSARLDATGQKLASYLTNGDLPPGLQQSMARATADAKAKVISNFAAQGLSTDPKQNTALAKNLAAIDQQAVISTAQIGQQLMTTGATYSGLSSGLYSQLAQIDATQQANLGKAIASMAGAFNSGGPTIKIGNG